MEFELQSTKKVLQAASGNVDCSDIVTENFANGTSTTGLKMELVDLLNKYRHSTHPDFLSTHQTKLADWFSDPTSALQQLRAGGSSQMQATEFFGGSTFCS